MTPKKELSIETMENAIKEGNSQWSVMFSVSCIQNLVQILKKWGG